MKRAIDVCLASALFLVAEIIAVQGQTVSLIPQAGWRLVYVDSEEVVYTNNAGTNAFDGHPGTFWHSRFYKVKPPPPHEIQIDLGGIYGVAGFRYLPRQDGQTNGWIGDYEFYVSLDGEDWGAPVAVGRYEKNGLEKERTFETKPGRYVRLRALNELQGLPYSAVAELNVLESNLSNNQAPESVMDLPVEDVVIEAGQVVMFSGTGSDPDGHTPLSYYWDFGVGSGVKASVLKDPGAVQFVAPGVYTVSFTTIDALGEPDPTPARRRVTVLNTLTAVPRMGWSVRYVDSEEVVYTNNSATNAIDGNPGTFWHSRFYKVRPPPPHEIQVNLGAVYNLAGFLYLPRQDGQTNGWIGDYEFYVSFDGTNWGTPVAVGRFANDAQEKAVYFAAKAGQYVRFRALNELHGLPYSAVAELNLLQKPVSGNQAPESVINAPASNVRLEVGQAVTFSGTGTDPEQNTPLSYYWDFGYGAGVPPSTLKDPGVVQFNYPGTYIVRFTTIDALGQPDPTPAERVVDVVSRSATLIPRDTWSIVYVDSQETGDGPAAYALDGVVDTFWHTVFRASTDPIHPHKIQIDMGSDRIVCGFKYTPRQDISNGRIRDYAFYVSADGVNWAAPVATGSFPDGTSEQDVFFTPVVGRFIALVADSEVNDQAWTTIAELNVFQKGSESNQPPDTAIDYPAENASVVAGSAINFYGSGTDLDSELPLRYRWTFGSGSQVSDIQAEDAGFVRFNCPGVYNVTLTAIDSAGLADPTPATRTITVLGGGNPISNVNWQVMYASSQESAPGATAAKAIDGDLSTYWRSSSNGVAALPPHEIQVDLGAFYEIAGFRYVPQQNSTLEGHVKDYRFYVSSNGTNWGSPVSFGTFQASEAHKEVQFASKYGRFVKFRITSTASGQPAASVAELEILKAPVVTPSVRLVHPTSYALQSSGVIHVVAVANLTAEQGIKLMIDGGIGNGGNEINDYDPPYEVLFEGLQHASHWVDAVVIDSSGQPVFGAGTHDRATHVGIGDAFVAMGDSITQGIGDDFTSDNESADGLTAGGGYPPILADRLRQAFNRTHVIFNEGIGSTQSSDGSTRVPLVLQRHPNASTFLLLYGSNDTRPSGLGLQPGASGYAGSYKEKMQSIIDDIRAASKNLLIAKIPAAIPVNGTKDLRMQEYNLVIDELVADPRNGIFRPSPDMHQYFRYQTATEYSDAVHMNGLGYQSMAELWDKALHPINAPGSTQVMLTSPNDALKVQVQTEGTLSYSLIYRDKMLLSTSRLGLKFLDGTQFGRNVRLSSVVSNVHDGVWENRFGKRRLVRDRYAELELEFLEDAVNQRVFKLICRAYDDGFAFRYVLPAQAGFESFTLDQELTEFAFTNSYRCFPGSHSSGSFAGPQEWLFEAKNLAQMSESSVCGLPLLVQTTSAWLAITEADLIDWSGMWLQKAKNVSLPGVTLATKLAPRREGSGTVAARTPALSPWRVIMVGPEAGRLIESDIVQNLATPSQISDTSWIMPGVMAWDHWWSRGIQMDTATAKDYIELAANMGWPYQLVDWQWYGAFNTASANITQPTPALDLDEILTFAKSRNVRIWLWLHWADLARNDAYLSAFPLYKKWGIAGVKVDFMDSDDQFMVNWYDKILQAAASNQLMVNFHGAFKPTGRNRTWPNELTREGVLGNEYNRWSTKVNPAHKLMLPFTRMLAGAMDFTPGGFLNRQPASFVIDENGCQVQGTRASELALFVVYDSPLICAADHPENYYSQPGVDFLEILPTVWDDTRVLHGEPGQYVAIVRQSGSSWFLGAVCDTTPRTMPITLNFLPAGQWTMRLWKDASDSNVSAEHIQIEQRSVVPGETINLQLAPSGGAAAVFLKTGS